MISDRAVASFAADGLFRENRIAILVVGTRNVKRGACVTKDATFSDGTREIRILRLLISGSQVVGIATFIKSDGRLEEVSSDVSYVAAGVVARADHIVDVEVADVSGGLNALPGAGRQREGSNLAFGSGDSAAWFLVGAAESVSHCRARVAFDFGGVADLAAIGPLGLADHG